MTRPRNNRRVVTSDSEPDLDSDSDRSTDHVNATKQSSGRLSSDPKSSIGRDSNDSSEYDAGHASDDCKSDELGDTSGKTYDETSNGSSNKKDSSPGHTTIRPGTDTPCPIGGSKTVKRNAYTRDIDPHNIISPSSLSPNKVVPSQDHHEPPGKRQRLTRGHGRSVNYDMKHHPMDDVLRPNFSAKRRMKMKQIPEVSSESDSEVNETPSRKDISSDPRRRRSSRNTHRSEKPNYSAKFHPLDQMLKDLKKDGSSKESCKKSNDSDSNSTPTLDLNKDVSRVFELGYETTSISPDRRRSVRVSLSKATPPNYDMKYHVMDSTLRPKAATKRLKSKIHSTTSSESPSNLASSTKPPTNQQTKASKLSSIECSISPETHLDASVTPDMSQLQNPYLNQTSLEWSAIEEIDRRVYLLQKGAPLHGNTLPQDWTHDVVKKALSNEDTFDEFDSGEGIELLKTRYESVRLGLQKFFGSKLEPVNKNDWTIFRTEGFDVYDTKRGKKYWRHLRNSIMEGAKTSSGSGILWDAAETAENMTHDRSNEPQTRKPEVKPKKRKSRVDIAIAVHEDLPGRTPLVKKIVSMNPASPGTDIPKENLEGDGSVEHSSQVEMNTTRARQQHEAISTPSTGRVGRRGSATSATPPRRSLFGGPLGSSSPSDLRTTG